MILTSLFTFLWALPVWAKITLVFLGIGFVFAAIKKFVKLAIYMAVLAILVLVIMKFVGVSVI